MPTSLNAAVAQLVERNLAKVEVESSRLFCRSRFSLVSRSWLASMVPDAMPDRGAIAKRLCTGLQIRVGRFDSGSRLQENIAAVAQLVERNLAKVEVESSRLFCRSRFSEKGNLRVPFFICTFAADSGRAAFGWMVPGTGVEPVCLAARDFRHTTAFAASRQAVRALDHALTVALRLQVRAV